MEIKSTTLKSYATDKVGDWNLNYEWESADGKVPVGINVRGDNGNGGFVNANLSIANSNISFGGGAAFDLTLAGSIIAESNAIIASFTPKSTSK